MKRSHDSIEPNIVTVVIAVVDIIVVDLVNVVNIISVNVVIVNVSGKKVLISVQLVLKMKTG